MVRTPSESDQQGRAAQASDQAMGDQRAESLRLLNYGVRPDKLAQVIWGIADVYAATTGQPLGETSRLVLEPSFVLAEIRRLGGTAEFRFGSELSFWSRLLIDSISGGLLRFRLSSMTEKAHDEEGIAMEERFKAGVNKSLLESGFGEPLPSWLE